MMNEDVKQLTNSLRIALQDLRTKASDLAAHIEQTDKALTQLAELQGADDGKRKRTER